MGVTIEVYHRKRASKERGSRVLDAGFAQKFGDEKDERGVSEFAKIPISSQSSNVYSLDPLTVSPTGTGLEARPPWIIRVSSLGATEEFSINDYERKEIWVGIEGGA